MTRRMMQNKIIMVGVALFLILGIILVGQRGLALDVKSSQHVSNDHAWASLALVLHVITLHVWNVWMVLAFPDTAYWFNR